MLYEVGKELQMSKTLCVICDNSTAVDGRHKKGQIRVQNVFFKSCGSEIRFALSQHWILEECYRAAVRHEFVLSFPLFYYWPQFSHC